MIQLILLLYFLGSYTTYWLLAISAIRKGNIIKHNIQLFGLLALWPVFTMWLMGQQFYLVLAWMLYKPEDKE